MGSFNTTCAISRAPILEGNKVRLFFLVAGGSYRKNIFNGCMCYPHDNFQIVGYPLEATYADYNNYDIEESSISKYTFEQLVRDYSMNKVEEGKTIKDYNPYHDHMEIPKEDLDWAKIQDIMHSGRFFFNHFCGERVQVTTMAVHESVYQLMVNTKIGGYDFEKKEHFTHTLEQSIDQWSHRIKTFNDGELSESDKESYKELLESMKSRIGTELVKPQRPNESLSEEERTYTYTQDMYDQAEKSIFARAIRRSKRWLSDERRPHLYRGYLEYEIETLGKDLAKPLAELEHFNVKMATHNMMYQPVLTSGQCYNFGSHAEFLTQVADAVTNIKSKWADEEHLPFTVTKTSTITREIKLSELKETLVGWFDAETMEKPFADLASDAGDFVEFHIDLSKYENSASYFAYIHDNAPDSVSDQVVKILMKE